MTASQQLRSARLIISPREFDTFRKKLNGKGGLITDYSLDCTAGSVRNVAQPLEGVTGFCYDLIASGFSITFTGRREPSTFIEALFSIRTFGDKKTEQVVPLLLSAYPSKRHWFDSPNISSAYCAALVPDVDLEITIHAASGLLFAFQEFVVKSESIYQAVHAGIILTQLRAALDRIKEQMGEEAELYKTTCRELTPLIERFTRQMHDGVVQLASNNSLAVSLNHVADKTD